MENHRGCGSRFRRERVNALSISPEAVKDLEGIKAYIAEELGNPTAALAMVTRIIQGIKQLRVTPTAYPSLASKVPFDTNYRFLICGNYIVFYRHEDKTIFVDRILYGKRDYAKILFPELPQDDTLEDEDS